MNSARLSIKNKSTGFTLIELLVVISIIALLSSVVLVAVNAARTKARDAERTSELAQIEKALYFVADKNSNNFPASAGTAKCLGLDTAGTCFGGTIAGLTSLNTALAEFLKAVPADPLVSSRSGGKGDRYLYADAASNIARDCTGAVYDAGPMLLWVPDVTTTPVSSQCGPNAYAGCCGAAMNCTNGNVCYKLIGR